MKSTWTKFFSVLICSGLLIYFSAHATKDAAATAKGDKKMKNPIAIMDTSEGKIKIELFEDKAPNTVKNFITLADGTNVTEGIDAKYKGKKYYDGLTFHRIIPQFMIQGGCPLGTGTGSPGYTFPDEIHPDLKHKPFVLSMANAGPGPKGKGTNGSQFFITTVETSWLNGKHSVFGEVIEGKEVVQKIEKLGTPSGAPSKPVKINSVTIERN